MWPPTSQQKNTAIVLTSRGCKHACEFCASSSVWGRGVRYRSTKNIVAELRELKARFDTNTIVIIDQSFGQQKERTLDVCRAIREAELGMHWYHQSNLTVHREAIEAMADAGCTKIGFGLEGISPAAAERVKPVHPSDFDWVNDLFDYCTSLGLFVKAYLMIGFPWEDEAIIREYFEWLPKLRASQIKISFMTPFPGTAYWEQYSDQLVTNDWSHFDTVSMPVVRNPQITVEQYRRIRQELFRAFYGSPSFADGVRRMITRCPHYVLSYREFCRYLAHHGMITGQEEWPRLVGWNGQAEVCSVEKGRV
jgi:anaerobic magnesium-protoporphyrin IX monomethyl ester cyclase